MSTLPLPLSLPISTSLIASWHTRWWGYDLKSYCFPLQIQRYAWQKMLNHKMHVIFSHHSVSDFDILLKTLLKSLNHSLMDVTVAFAFYDHRFSIWCGDGKIQDWDETQNLNVKNVMFDGYWLFDENLPVWLFEVAALQYRPLLVRKSSLPPFVFSC